MAYVLLDIDGVLNPFLAWDLVERKFETVHKEWATWQLNASLHAPWIQALSEKATIVWCSSWEEASNAVSEHFGLPDFPFVKLSGTATTSDHGTWKLPYVEDFLRGKDDKVIWLDDEFEADAYRWSESRKNTLLLPCAPAVGFNEGDFRKALAFLS